MSLESIIASAGLRLNDQLELRTPMNTLDYQELDVFNKTRSNPALRDRRGDFTPEFVV